MAGFQLSINGRFWVSTEDEVVVAQVTVLGIFEHASAGYLNSVGATIVEEL
jgi:hypothetical protein